MSRMNTIANSVVGLVLRSPVHRMLDRTLVLVTYRGRRSGREYTLPVQYVRENRCVYIVVGEAEKKTWWRNLRGGAPVRLVLDGQVMAGQAEVWEGGREADLIGGALTLYLRRFPAAAASRHIRLQGNGSFNTDDLGREAQSAVMVHVALS